MKYTTIKKTVPSSDGKNTLSGVIYLPEGEIRGLFHLVHGMTEYIGRYKPLLGTLSSAGYLCFGFDNLGHGTTAKEDDLGFIAEKDGWKYLIDDVKIFADEVKKDYPDLPYILMGHSMGSFIVRMVAAKHGDSIDKLIICGTGGSNPLSGVGLALCKLIKFFRGERAISPFVENLVFGSYNKRFDGASNYEWLTKDREIIEHYEKDKFCTFHFTVSALCDLVTLNRECNRKKWFYSVRNNLPILIVSGNMDPVGDYGKGVKGVYNRLKQSGKENVTLFLYENCRHEIHNDSCRQQMTEDILKFIAK